MTHEAESNKIVLVAMGGHAFLQEGQRGTFEEQAQNADRIAELLMTLVERDFRLVITHGNGPQVGDLLIQHEHARDSVPAMPLDVLVAMTEGSLGYVLQKSLLNRFRRNAVKRYVVTVVTQVIVDADDPAFREPTKPIGPFLTREEAEARVAELGWKIREDSSGRGFRRLVSSPAPQRVLQRHMIRDAAMAGHVVIACGGGGIPNRERDDHSFAGVEAVVDKDLTSAVMGANVGAELLIILTAVPQVYLNFKKENQRALDAVTLQEVERLYEEGHFPPGSMGPKIRAVIHFLTHGGKRALITDPESLPLAIEGRAGTHFIGHL